MRQRRRTGILGLGSPGLLHDKKARDRRFLHRLKWVEFSNKLAPLLLLLGTAVPIIVVFLRVFVAHNKIIVPHVQPEPVQEPADTYSIFQCPDSIPIGYPREYQIVDVLNNWNINNLVPPESIYQGICVFDFAGRSYSSRRAMRKRIHNYRAAEVPFIIRNDPAVLKSVALWKKDNYLSDLLHGKQFQATLSNTTTVTYYSLNSDYNIVPEDFVAPNRNALMTFDEWLARATPQSTTTTNHQDEKEYAYLRLDACLPDKSCDSTYRGNPQKIDDADFIYSDLPFFYPSDSKKDSLYPIDADKARGIQCRLGTPGLVAEDHFDNERNYIAMLRGERRFLLGHPKNCPSLYLYPQKHPLERHTRIDWSQVPDHSETMKKEYPNFFANATINEVILSAGDVLYLPTYWFHHIVSLSVNYQCNTRSGYSVEYDQKIYDCGFFYDFPA